MESIPPRPGGPRCARRGAALELARRKPAEARGAAQGSIDAATRAGLPIEAERARIQLGQSLAAAGDQEQAQAELEAARTALDAFGAGHYRDQASQELRGLGLRVTRSEARKADADQDDPLSSREREIADLVVAGKRNSEIAETLFLSVRTVEGHLSRIFRKLEVTSRTQLAAVTREQE